MSNWSAEEWGVFLGAVGILIGAIAAAAVAIIKALRGVREEITHQTAQMNTNAEQITGSIRGTGEGGPPR